MKHTRLILFVATIIFTIVACNTTNHSFNKAFRSMTNAEKVIADSLILNALDHEAIYTLIDTLKPMSSIQFYRLPLLSNNTVQKDSAYQVLATLQNIELYVFRKSKLQQKIEEQTTFYKTLGITSGASPATVLAITEYEQKYNRWRSYGYLFGYPEYAVDFFVNAGKSKTVLNNL
jgi:hypothetical protein